MRSPGATVRKRLVLLMGGFFLLFLCVCARLVDVQIVRQKELTARGVKQWTRSGVVAARRGDIVDTNGRLLAQSVTSFILTARPRDVKDAGALAKVLARELGLDEKTILKKLSGSKAASVTLARQLSREDADRLRAIRQNGNSPDAEALIGITFDEDASRWYPMGTLLAQTLGLCNVDGEGQSGLELQYNDVLAGKPGKMITEVDARARTLPDGVTLYVPAEQGNTLRLTIDRDVQAAVERAVRECAQVNDAVSVQAIAMDVNTGALLAMAMYPTYDPANPPRDDLDRLNELMRLTVLSDVYEPGSTFKILTAAAAIDCGATSPQEGFYCSGRITVDGSTVRCWGAARRGDDGAGAGKFLQPGVHAACAAAGQRAVLPISACVRAGQAHGYRPIRRGGRHPHRAEPGEERRSGAHRLWAERRGHAHSDDYGGVRGGQRRAADEAISGGGH